MKTFTLQNTKHPKLFRIVDREGNWKNYVLVEKFKDSYKTSDQPTFSDFEKADYLRGVTTILDEGYPKGKGFEIYLARTNEVEQKEKLEKAGEKGSKVHSFIDLVLSTRPEIEGVPLVLDRETKVVSRNTNQEEHLSDDEWDTVLAWHKFWINHSPILLHSEIPFYSLKYGYAGTGDVIAILTRECTERGCACKGRTGKIGLLDWKTGKMLDKHNVQVCSYAMADNAKSYLPKGKKIDYVAAVRITPSLECGYSMKASKDMKQDFKRFLAAKELACGSEYKPFDPEKDVEEVPDSFQILVQRFDFGSLSPIKHRAKVTK